jgi:hypothetical protein
MSRLNDGTGSAAAEGPVTISPAIVTKKQSRVVWLHFMTGCP